MLISFGTLTYKLLIPLLYPSLYQIRRFVLHKETNAFYEVLMDFMSYSFAGLILLVITYRSKTIQVENEEKNDQETKKIDALQNVDNQILIDKQQNEKRKKRKQYISIFVLSCINLIPMAVEPFFYSKVFILLRESVGIFFAMFFYVSFSRVILGTKVYKHQYLALSTLILCLAIIFILDLSLYPKELPDLSAILQTIFYFFSTFGCYACFDVSGKRYFNEYLDEPYHLMFTVGIMSLCLFVPYDIFMYFVFPEKTNLHGALRELKNLMSPTYPLIFIADTIIGFLWLGGIWLTIYYFTPCHFIISEALSQLITSCINWQVFSKDYEFQPKIIYIFLFFVMIFASMVYNEVLILNFWGLNKDTKIQIEFRERFESIDDKVYLENNISRDSKGEEGVNMELNSSGDNFDFNSSTG